MPVMAASLSMKGRSGGRLTAKERDEIGGEEYRSLKLLLMILICLFAGLYLISIGSLVIWLWCSDPKYRDELAQQGIDPVGWIFFTTSSLITNGGVTLTPDSMMPSRDAPWPMILGTFLVKAGNTLSSSRSEVHHLGNVEDPLTQEAGLGEEQVFAKISVLSPRQLSQMLHHAVLE